MLITLHSWKTLPCRSSLFYTAVLSQFPIIHCFWRLETMRQLLWWNNYPRTGFSLSTFHRAVTQQAPVPDAGTNLLGSGFLSKSSVQRETDFSPLFSVPLQSGLGNGDMQIMRIEALNLASLESHAHHPCTENRLMWAGHMFLWGWGLGRLILFPFPICLSGSPGLSLVTWPILV